jgi:hypothetical protein
MKDMRNTTLFKENLNGRENLENLNVDGRTLLKLTLKKEGWQVWTGFI